MKLTPFESAIERVAERIIKKHRKDIEAQVVLFYNRAVGQAFEAIEAKASPAKKANQTRKRLDAIKARLRELDVILHQFRNLHPAPHPLQLDEAITKLDEAMAAVDNPPKT